MLCYAMQRAEAPMIRVRYVLPGPGNTVDQLPDDDGSCATSRKDASGHQRQNQDGGYAFSNLWSSGAGCEDVRVMALIRW